MVKQLETFAGKKASYFGSQILSFATAHGLVDSVINLSKILDPDWTELTLHPAAAAEKPSLVEAAERSALGVG